MKKVCLLFALCVACSATYSDVVGSRIQLINPFIVSVLPAQNAINIATDAEIRIQFAQQMNSATLNNNIWVYGSFSGKMQIQVSYNQTTFLTTVTPTNHYKAGELITVCIGSGNMTYGGQPISPFIYNFWVKSAGGSAWFAVGDTLVTGANPEYITSADIDADGLVDVAVVNYTEGSVAVCKNEGSANFSVSQKLTGFTHPWHCTFADVIGNQAPDLIIPDFEGFKVLIYENNGSGLFVSPVELNLGTGYYPFSVAIFDMDGDDDLDISIAIQGNNWKVFHYKNNGSGNFSYLGSNDCTIHPKFLLPMDVDNDGDMDLVVNHFNDNIPMMILTNNGQGSFSQSYTGLIGQRSDGISMGDLNNDNYVDIVTPNDYVDGVHYLLNDHAGNFNFYNLGNAGSFPWFSAINDFDGDGDHDFVIVSRDNYGFAPYVILVTNKGNNIFSLSAASYNPALIPSCVTAADFDNDGDIDLAVSQSAGNSFRILMNANDSMVACYPFNGNADDVSGNLNHGVVNGASFTNDRYGVADKACYFDGSSNYIEGTNPGNHLPEGSLNRTISCWVKSQEITGDRYIFHYGTAQSAPTNYHLFMHEGKYVGVGNGYGYGVLISNTNIGDNTWHHITGVYEGESNNLQQIFIDGKLDTNAVIATPPATVLSTNWKIGQSLEGSSGFLGKLDEIKVFNLALTSQEILDLYLSETTAPVLQQPANQATVTTTTPLMLWNSPYSGAEYKFQLASNSTFTELVYETATNNTSLQLPEGLIAEGITYYWRVRTTLNGETGPWTEAWTFNFVNNPAGELTSALPVLLFTPNPASSVTNLKYIVPAKEGNKVPVKIEMINFIGKNVENILESCLAPGAYEMQLQTSHFQPGVYFCRLSAGKSKVIQRLVILGDR